MAVTQDKPAPYASPSTIIALIERFRDRGLPSPINADTLSRAGVSDSLVSRTLQGLVALDLIDEEGGPTATFDSLRIAPETEYQDRLKEWLNGAYADVLAFVDPAADDETRIRDAFRSYKPHGQQARMVSLFLGLYAAAGVRQERQQAPRPQRQARNGAKQAPRSRPSATATQKRNQPKRNTPDATTALPAPLSGLLEKLPCEDRGWTKDQRDSFYKTFGVVLDFCFPIVSEEALSMPEEEDVA